uniref:Uncharacterized protein n=1 Tax=Tetranychus urticae TaxID=32264 RepID=T1KC50_TETUR
MSVIYRNVGNIKEITFVIGSKFCEKRLYPPSLTELGFVTDLETFREVLSSIQREQQAKRRGWISCRGVLRREELILFNRPNNVHDPEVNTRDLLTPVIESIENWPAKIFYLKYKADRVIIGLGRNHYKTEVCRVIEIFFVRLGDGEDDLAGLSEDLIFQNDLNTDEVTRVVSVISTNTNLSRVVMQISGQNRDILLERDGFISWRQGCTPFYDSIGLTVCERCYVSFECLFKLWHRDLFDEEFRH